MTLLLGAPKVTRFATRGDGHRNIDLTWPSGASVMVHVSNEDPEAVVSELQRLTWKPKRASVLSDVGCIRVQEDGCPWLLNKRENGWGSFGYEYPSWAALMDAWDIAVGAPAADEHGTYWPVAARAAQ